MQKLASKLHLPQRVHDAPCAATADKEPIKAYLRIRPNPDESSKEHTEPYIDVISQSDVIMNPPTDGGSARTRTHSKLPPTKYTFARVFGPQVDPQGSQAAFFTETTLPLVNELLQGESGLIFTYGVTNSGKSYTIQGGNGAGEAGILPRALDVVFNSIQGLSSTSNIWPIGLYGVERAPSNAASLASSPNVIDPWSVPSLSKRFAAEASKGSFSPSAYQHDPTKVKVDRNYRYSVWVSYVEVYNEKLFDLLDVGGIDNTKSRPSTIGFGTSAGGMTRSDSMRGSNWSIAGMATSATLTDLASAGGAISLSRKPLTLKTDPEGSGKYVAGLKEVRVNDIEEARELMKKGQDNRVVFGTMANRASSRSHGVFTIKVVREHAGADPDESLACTVSRLSIVDLAGSERISNTSSSGDRRKEAGSINKSLMCLGQCLDTLRKNQARAAAMIPNSAPLSSASGLEDAMSTPSSKFKRRPSVVPFRHSKLTELFQPFFTGEGRTVMIVNANPYDTGFDENSHVMKFSAVAKEVQIVRNGEVGRERSVHRLQNKPVPFPSSAAVDAQSDVGTPPGTPRSKTRSVPTAVGTPTSAMPASRVRQPVSQAPSRRDTGVSQPEITIIEESDEEDDEADESDPFVDLLMTKHEELRQRLHEAEMRAASIESSVREEMAQEMAQRLAEMERKYTERLLSDAESNEDFFNQKIDLLVKANTQEQQRVKARFDALATPRAGGRFHNFSTPRRTSPSKTPRGVPATVGVGARDRLRGREASVEESEVEESLQTALDTASEASNSFSLQPGPSKATTSRRSMLGVEAEGSSDEEQQSADEGQSEGDITQDVADDNDQICEDTRNDESVDDDEDEEDVAEEDEVEDEDEEEDSEEEEADESVDSYQPSADEEEDEDEEEEEQIRSMSRRKSTARRSQPSASLQKRRSAAATRTSQPSEASISKSKAGKGALRPSSSFNQQRDPDDDDDESEDDLVLKSHNTPLLTQRTSMSPKKRFFNKKSVGRVIDEEEMERRVERC